MSAEPAAAGPVLAHRLGPLDLGHPVDQRQAVGLGRARANRIDHRLADRHPARRDHGVAAEIGRPAHRTAPHVDARIQGRPLVGIELAAQRRMDAVAAHRDLAALRLDVVEMDRDARAVLVDLQAAMGEPHGVAAEALPHRVEHHPVQVGAMDRKLRPVVAGEAAARLLVDELAVTAVEGELARLDGLCGERVLQAEFGELAHGMRQQVDADAERQHVGRGLEHARRDAGLVQAERQRQPADAATDDQDIRVAHSGPTQVESRAWPPRRPSARDRAPRSRPARPASMSRG